MPRCDACGSMILFGGIRAGRQRFCDTRCQTQASLLSLSYEIPEEEFDELLLNLHAGACPRCGQERGPVDVHVTYRVWSVLVVTFFNDTPRICCRRCGVQGQLGGLFFSMMLGWWGFPLGIVGTPLTIGRNIAAMLSPPNPHIPSPQLEKILRMTLGARIATSPGPGGGPAR